MFRPALDRLANYLTQQFSSYAPGFEGEVQPPCNYPMSLQTAVMRLAEAVQASQDWDAQQAADGSPRQLPPGLLQTLESVLRELKQMVVVPGPGDGKTVLPVPTAQYVTLDMMAAIVTRSKRTLEKLKTRKRKRLPRPDVRGGGGKADEWLWQTVRPWLEDEFGRKLPERFPSDRFPGPPS
jgi:hypothetical protein